MDRPRGATSSPPRSHPATGHWRSTMSVIDGTDFDDSFQDKGKAGRPGPFRRLARWLWRLTYLSLLISPFLIFLVYVMIEPLYEAFSVLRIEPSKPELFGPSVHGMDSTDFQPYLETQ